MGAGLRITHFFGTIILSRGLGYRPLTSIEVISHSIIVALSSIPNESSMIGISNHCSDPF